MGRKKKDYTMSVQSSDGTFKPLNTDGIEKLLGSSQEEKEFIIKDATIKDDFCNYSYEIASGIGLGDMHSVKGKGIIEDDMRNAFASFNVHMACIDDVFKHSGVEVEDIDSMKDDQLTFLYTVTGFKIKGGKDDESIILIGNKYVSSAGGRIELETPKIPLDNLSSYKWYNELKAAADDARREVELYKEGKYTSPEADEPEEKFSQTKMTFLPPETKEDEDDFDKPVWIDPNKVDDFENAKL
jgi:hypothetical protein